MNNGKPKENEFIRIFTNQFDDYVNNIQMSRWWTKKENLFDSDEDFDNPIQFVENDIKRKYLMRMLKDTQKLTDAIQFQFDRCEVRMDKASKSKTKYYTLKFFEDDE
tara:strand:+ start:929 stop:1249 length:321 start_codon:yes stop_codon:yes gene_type:complete